MLSQKPIKHIFISDTIVYYPKINCVYHLKTTHFPDGETLITFDGNLVEKLLYIDLSSSNYGIGNNKFNRDIGDCTFVAAKTLHFDNTPKHLPAPLYVYNFKELEIVKFLNITISNRIFAWDHTGVKINIKPDNQQIEKDIEKIVPEVNVNPSDYPIYLRKNFPDISVYESWYKSFLSKNKKKTLDFQINNVKSKCHIRATFLNVLLESYGVQSFKITKYWNAEDWDEFPQKKVRFRFHTATLIKDRNNCYWVMDPWFTDHTKLLSVKEWFFRKDEPPPQEAMICNSICICGFSKKEYSISNFMQTVDNDDVKTMQVAFSTGVPNPPEFPISGVSIYQRQTLFYFMKREDQAMEMKRSGKKKAQLAFKKKM